MMTLENESKSEALKGSLSNVDTLYKQKMQELKDYPSVEKSFREARKLTVPEDLRKNVRSNVSNMRIAIKYYWNLKAGHLYMKRALMSMYRNYIRSYLRGNIDKCPKAYHLLIDEYREFLLNKPENQTELPNIDICNSEDAPKPNGHTKVDNVKYSKKKVLAILKTGIKNNWSNLDPKVKEMFFYPEYDHYVFMIKRYIEGRLNHIPEELKKILSNLPELATKVKEHNENKVIKKERKNKAEVSVSKVSKVETSKSIDFIQMLKDMGVKEFTLRF